MMLSLPASFRIWLAANATDLPKSFGSLAELVRQHDQGLGFLASYCRHALCITCRSIARSSGTNARGWS